MRERLCGHIRDDPDLAAHLEQAERDIRVVFSPTEWRIIFTAVVFAQIALGRDDEAGAERWTAEAEGLLLRYPDWHPAGPGAAAA